MDEVKEALKDGRVLWRYWRKALNYAVAVQSWNISSTINICESEVSADKDASSTNLADHTQLDV